MKSRIIPYLKSFCLSLLIMHFGFTLIYVLPQRFFPPVAVDWANSYMYPVFFQGWSLFAPDVADWQAELYYRYYKDGSWSEWTSTSLFPDSTHHPKLTETAEKLNHYLTVQLHDALYYDEGKPQYDKVILQGHYKSAVHYCRMHYLRTGTTSADSLQMRLEVDYSPNPGDNVSPEKESFYYPKLKVPKRVE